MNCSDTSSLTALTTLIQDADDKLFHCILCNSHHVLYSILPPPKSDNNYDLRKNRPHDRITLVSKTSLTECDYIMRMIFKDVY